MYDSTAQLAALVLYGNHFLQTGQKYEFFPNHSTCKRCTSVTFATFQDERRDVLAPLDVMSTTPQAWYEQISKDGVLGLRLCSRLPDAAAKSWQGGDRLIEAVYESSSDYWHQLWQRPIYPHRPGYPEGHTVTYRRIESNIASSPDQAEDLPKEVETLGQLLQSLQDFFRQSAPGFSQALEALQSPQPLTLASHPDLAPAGYLCREAEALLAAASIAWGATSIGQGMWYETASSAYDNDKTFNTLMRQLRLHLSIALQQGVNSSYNMH
jgi:hypothetical protein